MTRLPRGIDEASDRIRRSAERLARVAHVLTVRGDDPAGRLILRRELWLLTRRVAGFWWQLWRRR